MAPEYKKPDTRPKGNRRVKWFKSKWGKRDRGNETGKR